MEFKAVGTIRTPFKELSGMPIQASGARGVKGRVELKPEFAGGLQDLEGFSHLILIYCFHLCSGYSLKVKPFLDDRERGVFATRAPRRPNPIGISTVRLEKVEGSILYLEDVDIVDGTPLLDLKPFVPAFDSPEEVQTGWLEGKARRAGKLKSDSRFKEEDQD